MGLALAFELLLGCVLALIAAMVLSMELSFFAGALGFRIGDDSGLGKIG